MCLIKQLLTIISILITTTCHAQMDSTMQSKIDSLGRVMVYNNMYLNKRVDSLNIADTLAGIIGEIKIMRVSKTKGTVGLDPIFRQRLEAIERKLAAIKQIL